MTLSVIYFNDDKNDAAAVGIRCCADSLITGECGKLTPHAMKILKLNLSYDLGYSLINPQPLINHSIGFTFAGNLNVAMITYALMSHLCERLQPLPGYENTFPSIKNIAYLTAKTLQSYTWNFAELLEKKAFVEIVLFGFCNQENDFKAFHIKPVVTDKKLLMQINEIKIREIPYFAIGSGKKLLDEKYRKNGKFSPNLVRDIINDPLSEKLGVGGYFQRGWCNTAGIQLYCDIINISSDHLDASFCGFNISLINLETHIVGLSMFDGD